MKRLFILLSFLIIVWVGISYAVQQQSVLKNDIPIASVPKEESLPSQQVTVPQSIRIPNIQVDAIIESVGLDDKGRMDVPKDADNVAWYNLGYKPGEKGNAVFAGHLDKETGEPAVFWDIEKLKPGDTIEVRDAKGIEYTFSVVTTNKYPYNNFPIEEVFGEAEKSMLHLITCQGEWDNANKNYSHRVVVSAELVN